VKLFDSDNSASRLPVSVITGFLGSGKTTLLNRLLRHPEMADSAVIINEWGEVGIDHLLVETIVGEVAVMASGCVCCTLRSDLETTVRSLLVRRDNGDVPPFRRILVETTGLADPAPIMQMLLNNPLLSHFVRLDAVVTTVDAVNARHQLDQHPEAVKQVAIADRLLLTKTDLCDTTSIPDIEGDLAELNPGATVVVTLHGDVPPDRLFGAALFDPTHKTPDVQSWLRPDRQEHRVDEHHHDNRGIRSFCLTFDEPLPWETISGWLTILRQWQGENLLRVKGILHLRDEELPVVIHGVHHLFHPPVQLTSWGSDDRRSRIVFITRDLKRAEVEATLVPIMKPERNQNAVSR
jgi:G3E family GTPase